MTLRVTGMSKIEKIGLIFAVLFVVLAFVSVGIASAATIYVPDNYPTIQAAVNATTPGDTIIVRDGTYNYKLIFTPFLFPFLRSYHAR